MLLLLELNKIREGLMNNDLFLIRKGRTGLECSFVKQGTRSQVVEIKEEVLASELTRVCTNGILEGNEYQVFRHSFESFAIRVKAKKLYQKLTSTQAMEVPIRKKVKRVAA